LTETLVVTWQHPKKRLAKIKKEATGGKNSTGKGEPQVGGGFEAS